MPAKKPEALLREFALSFPEAWEDFPWGERVFKVRKKVFVFNGKPEGAKGLHLAVKLPESGEEVLLSPFAEPTGYGLGKSGWVSLVFEDPKQAPMPLLRQWVEESYRSVAPKTLVKQLDEE